MRIINGKSEVARAAEAWGQRHAHNRNMNGEWLPRVSDKAKQRYEKVRQELLALDPETATPRDVNRIAGKHSASGRLVWEQHECNACGLMHDTVVEVCTVSFTDSEYLDVTHEPVYLCEGCVTEALALLVIGGAERDSRSSLAPS